MLALQRPCLGLLPGVNRKCWPRPTLSHTDTQLLQSHCGEHKAPRLSHRNTGQVCRTPSARRWPVLDSPRHVSGLCRESCHPEWAAHLLFPADMVPLCDPLLFLRFWKQLVSSDTTAPRWGLGPSGQLESVVWAPARQRQALGAGAGPPAGSCAPPPAASATRPGQGPRCRGAHHCPAAHRPRATLLVLAPPSPVLTPRALGSCRLGLTLLSTPLEVKLHARCPFCSLLPPCTQTHAQHGGSIDLNPRRGTSAGRRYVKCEPPNPGGGTPCIRMGGRHRHVCMRPETTLPAVHGAASASDQGARLSCQHRAGPARQRPRDAVSSRERRALTSEGGGPPRAPAALRHPTSGGVTTRAEASPWRPAGSCRA